LPTHAEAGRLSKSRWTIAEIPDQSGRTVVITGANTGIGYEAAAALAQRGAQTVLAVRNLGKGKAAAARIRAVSPGADVRVQELDLSSLASIHAAADALRSNYPRIDLLINNAGLISPEKSVTEDGFEVHIGVNHLGHFALTGLLLDRIVGVPGSRVVCLTSIGHRVRHADIDFGDLHWQERKYEWTAAYGQSKLANLMFTYELQRRLVAAQPAHTVAAAAHPGMSKTDLARNAPWWISLTNAVFGGLMFQSPQMGALPTLRAATDPSVTGGQLYGPNGRGERRGHPRPVRSSPASYDEIVQRRLWKMSEELTGVTFPI